MLAIDRNRATGKELKRFKTALREMENYIRRMLELVEDRHHSGYVATSAMEAPHDVAKFMCGDEARRDTQMVFRFDISGQHEGRVTYAPLIGGNDAVKPLMGVGIDGLCLIRFFLDQGSYSVLVDLAQDLINKHNNDVEAVKDIVTKFTRWVDQITCPDVEAEPAMEESYEPPDSTTILVGTTPTNGCMFDNIKPGTVTGLVCTCPKCSPQC